MELSSKKQNKFILSCTCPDMPKFSREAFKILFPNDTVPEIYAGENKIYALADKFPNTNFGNYAKALAKNKEKFAYYFEISENGDVKTQINLKTGAKVC